MKRYITAVMLFLFLTCGCKSSSNSGAGNNNNNDNEGNKEETFTVVCPGLTTCESTEGPLMVGASKTDISPPGFEVVNPNYMKKCYFDAENPWDRHGYCVSLNEKFLDYPDCGTDGVCDFEEDYPGPDPDGSEGDGKPDWFFDCGWDRLCPGDDGYPGADYGEGNGQFDGFWLAGFHRNRPMKDIHDPIWSRTIVIEKGDVAFSITSLDFIGLFHDDVDKIREKVSELRPDVDLDYILISSTHDHEAPDSMGQWGIADPLSDVPDKRGVNEYWMDWAIEQIANDIINAYDSVKEANLYATKVFTGVDSLIYDHRDPKIYDDEMTLLRFVDKNTDETIATLVNWANHPEGLSDINDLLSADFVYYTRKYIEEGLPQEGDAPAINGIGGIVVYMSGAVGGMMTPLGVTVHGRDGNTYSHSYFDKVEAMGKILAEKALNALANAEKIDETDINPEIIARTFLFPVDNKVFQTIMLFGHINPEKEIFKRDVYNFDWTKEISDQNKPYIKSETFIIRLSKKITIFGVPGELLPELAVGGYDGSRSYDHPIIDPDNPNPPDLTKAPKGPYLREKVGGDYVVLCGLCNDEVGYIIPPYNFKLAPGQEYFEEADGDHYEETNSLGPDTAPILIDQIEKILDYESKNF